MRLSRSDVCGFVILALVCVLAFGGLAHEIVPHEHSEFAAIENLMHGALRHEEKQPVVAPVLIVLSALALVASASAVIVRHVAESYMLSAVMCDTMAAQLRKGILAYRRFG